MKYTGSKLFFILILLAAESLLFPLFTEAQNKKWCFQAGFKGGLSTSFIDFQEGSFYGVDSKITLKAEEKKPSLQLGFFSRITFLESNFFFQPEVLLNKGEITVRLEDNLIGHISVETKDHTLNRWDIFVPVGYKFGKFRLQTGPRLSILSKDELKILYSRQQKLNNVNWGYRTGLGIDIWKFALDLHYEYSSTNIGDLIPIVDGAYGYIATRSQFILSLGLLI